MPYEVDDLLIMVQTVSAANQLIEKAILDVKDVRLSQIIECIRTNQVSAEEALQALVQSSRHLRWYVEEMLTTSVPGRYPSQDPGCDRSLGRDDRPRRGSPRSVAPRRQRPYSFRLDPAHHAQGRSVLRI